MRRAAVLIGVATAGDLPFLPAVADGVRSMEEWARSQGMADEYVKVITDQDAPVEAHQIKRAVRDLCDSAVVEQLTVYFAGHGVNINYGERWLLSDAIVDTQAAVNVDTSVQLARWCGVPNVVLISDACRTAAEGIQAQAVTGSEIFPNNGPTGAERDVDIFFACAVGKAAMEIRDPDVAAGRFSAVYTEALADALTGEHPTLLDRANENGADVGFVRMRRLGKFLPDEIARRLRDRRVAPETWQVPAARITSDDQAWLSRLPWWVGSGPTRGDKDTAPPHVQTLTTVSHTLLRHALTGTAEPPMDIPPVGVQRLTESASRAAKPFGPSHFETECGFKLRGGWIHDVYSVGADAVVSRDLDLVKVSSSRSVAAPVLITFGDGRGALLPALRGYIAGLTYADGELVDVVYEPSEGTSRWAEYQYRADELRQLRGVVAAAAELGVFTLDGPDAPDLASKMQIAKGVDPTMAVYAAYAYNSVGHRGQVRVMSEVQRADLGVELFDVALLAGRLNQQAVGPGVSPFVPLLSQGWALLPAFGTDLPDRDRLASHVVPSLWTLFDPDGVDLIRSTLARGLP